MHYRKKVKEGILGYLTHDVTDRFGRLLLVEGTPLTKGMIQKLNDRKICFRTAKSPLGLNAVASNALASDSVFMVPKQLDKKFEKLDIVHVQNASNYLSFVLRTIQEDFFLSSNLKAMSQGLRETYSHSINVGIISVAIARKMNFDKKSLQEITIGALFHDVGKILLPPSAFKDNSRICAGQDFLFEQHPRLGADLLAAEKLPSGLCLTVRQHHERYSGNGYPDGLREDEIHVNSFVVSVADVFDRLTTSTYPENAISPNEAIERIISKKGIDFHPHIVELFLELFRKE